MDVEKDVALLIWGAVTSDDINKLDAWFKQRPDFLYLLDKHLHENALSFAIENNRIRLFAHLLSYNNQPHYEKLLEDALQSESEWIRRVAKLSLRKSLHHAHSLTKDITECWRPMR